MIRVTAIALCNCILQIFQVRPPRSRTSFIPFKSFLTLHSSATPGYQNNCTHIDLSSINCSSIAQSLRLRCSFLLENQGKHSALANPSLKDFLLEISDVVPDYARKFRRKSELTPQHVLELLLGFQSEFEGREIQLRKIECLWGIFEIVNERSEKFKHLSRSYEVMASLLIRVGKLKEVELLLSKMEIQGILLDNPQIFSRLVESFVDEDNLEGAILMYQKMKQRCMSQSLSCYPVFLHSLVRMKKTQLALEVCMDMLESNCGLADFENVVRLLCQQGKILEARNLVKKFVASGFKPSNGALHEITCGYCEKKDFEDLLTFFFEIKCPPDVFSGNKIINSLCNNFGSDSANLYLRELEHTGFKPDEITFGILIGWSCCERNLRNALFYFSDMLSNGLKPDILSYNALMSGMLKEGLWKHAQGILDEMVDKGIPPNLSTFRILLAGYCKARRFEEAKSIVLEMEKRGLIQISSVDDLLCRIFSFLGLGVRLKRDNNAGVSKTEFFDSLGNGLYLEGDMDEYEKRVTEVLEESILPDFNLLIIEECRNGDWKAACRLVAKMAQWGQELSFIGLMGLLKSQGRFNSHLKPITSFWEKNPLMIAQLGSGTINFIVQAYSKKGLTSSGLGILNEMVEMHIDIQKETYTTLIKSLCGIGNVSDLLGCLNRARKDGWVPGSQDCDSLVRFLCKMGKLNEVIFLLESMLLSYPHSRLDIIHIFLKSLSDSGFASIGCALVEELLSLGFSLDQKAYEVLIIGMCKERKISIAINILEDMMTMDMVPCMDVCLPLFPALCKAGRYKTAIALKERAVAELSFSSSSVCSALVEGFCVTGKIREAFTLLPDMLLKGFSPDAEIYNLLLQGLCRLKSFGKLWELLGIIIKNDLSLSTSSYRQLVRLMCMEGRNLQALYLKDLMLRYDEIHNRVIYNILIFYLFRSGNSFLVGKTLVELQKRKLSLDDVTYDFLVYGFYRCKDISSSTFYLFTMIGQEFQPSKRSLNCVVSHLCDIGELGKALELSRGMESRGWIHSSSVQNAIIEGLVTKGKIQEAEYFLDRMVDKRLAPEHIDYNNIIRQFSDHGRLSKAVDLINIMLKKGSTPRSTSYDSVIQCCCNCNKLQEAMDFHTEMLDRGLKPNITTWEKLVSSFCRNGQLTEAERILNHMSQMGETPSKDVYGSMLNRYRHENDLKKTSETMRAMQRCGYELDFETQWSLISKLTDATVKDKNNNNSNKGFLSALLSKSGFSQPK